MVSKINILNIITKFKIFSKKMSKILIIWRINNYLASLVYYITYGWSQGLNLIKNPY